MNAKTIIDNLSKFDVARAIKLSAVSELVSLKAEDELMADYEFEYSNFIDAYPGDVSKATKEEFRRYVEDKTRPEDMKTSLVLAKCIAANIKDDEMCVIPGWMDESSDSVKFSSFSGASSILDSVSEEICTEILKNGECRAVAFMISDGDDMFHFDIQTTFESKGAQDCRAMIKENLQEAAIQLSAKSFIFCDKSEVEDDNGYIDEFVMFYAECANGDRDVFFKKILRDSEGKIGALKNVGIGFDPDEINSYFSGIFKTDTFN
jgi:hypothetical protein